MRIDKYLWVIRAFKTRSLAGKMVEQGEVTANGRVVQKTSHSVKLGDVLHFPNPTLKFRRSITVLALAETRGPAPVAQTLYQENEAPPKADPFAWDGVE